MLHKKTIIKKTALTSFALLLSKMLGIVRELFQVRYLGVGAISDAFNIAFKIPQALRKVFAEGALAPAFIPTIVSVMKKDSQEQADRLMTLMALFFGTVILLFCVAISLFPEPIILLSAPGYKTKPVEFATATGLVAILIYFVFFIFSSALLAAALQAKSHFAIPSWGPALLNVFYIAGLITCLYYDLSVLVFAYFLLVGALAQVLLYLFVYFKLGFSFLWPDGTTYQYFKQVIFKFLPAVVSVSAVEINLLIDNRFASLLPAGSATLLGISSRFMGIALGAFAVAFSTILLTHFSRISTYAPKRLGYYLFESTKLILWVTAPVALLMSFFSYDIFYTIFYRLAQSFTMAQVEEATMLLIAFLPGLFFFSLNKVMVSIYSSLHEIRYATAITLVGAISNVGLNRLLVPSYGAAGIAIATSFSAVIQSILLMVFLHLIFGLSLYVKQFLRFCIFYAIQLSMFSSLFYILYRIGRSIIGSLFSSYTDFFLHQIGLWFWIGPLCLGLAVLLFMTRKKYGINLYFFE